MALYSFITRECNSDIQKHGLTDTVRKYAAKIERDQAAGSVDLYPFPIIKRNVRKHFRLIIEERRVGEDVVYCFLRVFQRSASDYAHFMSLCNQGKSHRFSEKHGPSSEEVLAYLYERRTQNRVEPLPALSPAEHTYLMGLSHKTEGSEQSIIESRTWVERISNNVKPGLRSEYYQLIHSLLWEKEIDPGQTVIGEGNFWILYRYFTHVDKLFLVGPLEPSVKDSDESDLRKRYQRIFDAPDRSSDDIIRQEGLRSYPSLVTADKDLWLDIQDSKDSNLSLSPEEMDVLNSVLNPSSNGNKIEEGEAIYPLFINGRPGSGKSTILLYLFAEHLHFHLKQIWSTKNSTEHTVLEKSPIYLTHSERLLNDARRTVQDLLRCDSEKSQSPYDLNDYEIKQIIENSFGNFRTFIRLALPASLKQQFDLQRFVDFPHFRRIFLNRMHQDANSKLRTLSPEIAWHVIRTYIKGMRQQTHAYLDIDAYEHELPRKQKSVTHATFELIFTEVWVKFYKPYCDEEGYWDDQDLARTLLDLADEGRTDLSLFPAIFCDESQDFTKIELELIFQFSRFSKRSLKLNELHSILPRIPFAFAGDPFQTLNPTGFDWDATKAFFHNTIVRPLDPAGRANLTFNYQELEFNYRSSQPIVQFCNLIQLMRGRAFNLKDIKPQKTWQISPSLDPIFYDIAELSCQQAMQTQQSLVYIIPCQEGEEADYVKKDPFLKRIAWNEEEQSITRDVLSPNSVKGLQFQRVVLYKFGEHALDAYQDKINFFLDPVIENTREEELLSQEDTLPLHYFVNHLYVAASRPRQQLIVVDTKKALDNFWAFAIEGNQQALIYSFQSRTDWQQDNITRLIQGSKENWYQIQDDALMLGHDFFARGQEMRDPYFMDRARQNYLLSGERELADQALAQKLFYEGSFHKAGKVYARLKQPGQALSCFWKSRSYEEIVRLHSSFTSQNPKHLLLFEIADYMAGDRTINASLLNTERIIEAISSDREIKRQVATDSHWTDIIQETIQHLALKIDDNEELSITPHTWKNTWFQILGILETGIVLSDTISLARIACISREYEASKKLLVENNIRPGTTSEWATRVFAETATFPENIRWLSQLELHQRVIEAYESSIDEAFHEKALSDRDATIIFESYVHAEEFVTAHSFLNHYPNELRFQTLIATVIKKERYQLANQLAIDLLRYYVSSSKWEAALQYVTPLPVVHESSSENSVRLLMDPARGHAYFIRMLARSESLPRESSLSQRDAISKYLKAQFANPSKALQENVQLHEAGTALEKAGIFKDILSFYESIINHAQDNNSKLREWAELRWVKTKFRQASSIKDDLNRKKVIEKATSKLKSWNIPKNNVQVAPKFQKLNPIQSFELPVEDILVPDTTAKPAFTEQVEQTIESKEPSLSLSTSTTTPAPLPAWQDIPEYTNHKDDASSSTIDVPPAEQEALPRTIPTNGESSPNKSHDIGGDILPIEPDRTHASKPEESRQSMPDTSKTEHDDLKISESEPLRSSEEIEDVINIEVDDPISQSLDDTVLIESPVQATADSPGNTSEIVASIKSPPLILHEEIPSIGQPYVQETPINVSFNILLERHAFTCTLIHRFRVLEIRNQISQERIDVLAESQEVRDSYGTLTIEKDESENESSSIWRILGWPLTICLESQGSFVNLVLLHPASGKTVLRLQL